MNGKTPFRRQKRDTVGRPLPKAVDEEDEEAGFTSRLFTVVRQGDPSSGGSLHGLFCSNATCSSEEADDDGDGAKMVFCSMVGGEPDEAGQRLLEYAFLVPTARPPAPLPILLWIHGGDFEARGALAPAALPGPVLDALRCGEFAVALLTHRLCDEPSGLWPAPWEDLVDQIEHVRGVAATYGCDPTRLVACGVHSGGFLAALLATRGAGEGIPVVAAVDLAGQASFADLARDRGEAPDRLWFWEAGVRSGPESRLMGFDVSDPANKHKLGSASPHNYSRSAVPLFIGHGNDDAVIPVAQSLRLFHALRDAGAQAEMRLVPGVGRDETIDQSDMPIEEAVDFLRHHLGIPTAAGQPFR